MALKNYKSDNGSIAAFIDKLMKRDIHIGTLPTSLVRALRELDAKSIDAAVATTSAAEGTQTQTETV